MEVAPLLVARSEGTNRLSLADLELARRLYLSLSDLHQYTTLWTAMNMSWLAVSIYAAPLRYLTFWVALESLFGAKEPGEITFKLSQRVALFLCEKRADGPNHAKIAKKLYGKRSAVAHGSIRNAADIAENLGATEQLVRASLTKILSDTQLMRNFDDEQRDDYLTNLPYTAV